MNINQNMTNEGPKISFLEAFYGVLFSPKKIFEDLYHEDTFAVVIYGILSVLLSNLGKIEPGNFSFLNIFGIEVIGIISWGFVAIFIFFLSTVFKTPNNNLGRLLGFTGLSTLPYLLLAPLALVASLIPFPLDTVFSFFGVFIGVWSFILFWIALGKSFQLEAWRIFLMAIIPFLLGFFLFTFLVANLFGLLFSGTFMR